MTKNGTLKPSANRFQFRAWDHAKSMAIGFMLQLEISCKDSRQTITWSEKRSGYRVTVLRLKDGMTKTGFVSTDDNAN